MRLFSFVALLLLGFLSGTCTPDVKPVASFQKTDSLEYYFAVANNDSADIPVRKRSADRAKALVETLPKDSIYVKNMFRVANRYWNMGKFDDYGITLTALKTKIDHIKLQPEVASKLNMYLGDFYRKRALYSLAYNSYITAEKLAKDANHYPSLLSALSARANLHFEIGDFQKCETLSYRGLKAAAKHPVFKHVFWNLCGMSAHSIHQYEKAISAYSNAIRDLAYAKEDEKVLIVQYYSNLGAAYLSAKNPQTALRYFDLAGKYLSRFPDLTDTWGALLENKNLCALRLGRGYSVSDNQRAMKSGYDYKSYGLVIACKRNKGEYFTSINNFSDCQKELRDALQIAISQKLANERLNCLKDLILSGDPKTSFFALDYVRIHDSIRDANLGLRDRFSAIEYETGLLKEQNQHLLTQNQKIIIGASSVGVLLLGGLFARHYRARKKEVQLLRERQAADDEIFQLLQQQQEKVEEGRKLEKRRISQELHDGVMGKLSGIRLNLFVLNKRNDPETVSKCLGHIDKIQEVEKEIRSIAYDLENDLFGEDRSFSALLRTLVQSAKDVSTTQFHLDLDAAIQWDAIPNTVKIQLYRVLQEALTNIRKYAQAKAVHITLKQRTQHLWVVVTDDGIGFTPSAVQKGLGLTNMETRIRQQGGSFKIKSTQGGGTTLVFILPLKS